MKVILSGFRLAAKVLLGLSAVVALPQLALAVLPVVKTVPVNPADATVGHTACPASPITLKGTSSVQGANFMYDWDFGDGSAHATGAVTNQYNVSATHTYAGTNLQNFIAILKITDTGTSENASSQYLLQFVTPCNLAAQVNIAIDEGLWYLHRIMWRSTSGATPGSVGAIAIGGWDVRAGSPGNPAACTGGFQDTVFSGAYAGCDNYNTSGVIDADNVQAFEVNSHLESGPASDPYTDDVARGLARTLQFLRSGAIANVTINYVNASCPAPPCTFNPDSNANGIGLFSDGDGLGQPHYEGGQMMDAIVASGTPAAMTITGGTNVIGRKYSDIITDLADEYAYCQYNFAPGGAWLYGCQQGVDNSVSQWAAIGFIGGSRGFGVPIPAMVTSGNAVWSSNSEAANGSWGYRGPAPIWGPYADTPSGLVQMAMDSIGRGDPRWDKTEAFMRDNFCNNPNAFPNNPAANAANAPKAYTYGLFSFTKGMLLHDPGGVLTQIKNLQDAVNPSPPAPIDWYGAELSAGAPCDGVARSLVDRQGLNGGYPPNPAVPTNGYWIGHSYYAGHFPFETAWSIIMLQKSVFIKCVDNLVGKGTPSGRAPARIDVTWSTIPSAVSYNVLRGTVSGGPYTLEGNSVLPAFSDTHGLLNGGTYYYVLKPLNSSGGEICTSNEAKITIPAQGR
jgi:hypothetical protein